MFYNRNCHLPIKNVFCAFQAMICLLLSLAVWAQTETPAPRPVECPVDRCLIVEYEESLAGEAATLVDALAIRLARYDMTVRIGAGATDPEITLDEMEKDGSARDVEKQWFWVVHLRQLSGEFILLAVDNRATSKGDDVVREIRRAESIGSTAWTMAIVVEEAVTPYLEKGAAAALGAGLAIIEPPAVGGVKKEHPIEETEYPYMRSLGLALTMYTVLETGDFIAGPRFMLEGAFSNRVTASVSIAWAGWSDFHAHDVDGSQSLVPIDILFGYAILPGRMAELAMLAGVSVGFAVYKTSGPQRERLDLLFEPSGQVLMRAIFHIYGPWTIYADGGVALPFVRDVLKNQNQIVYERGWIVPIFDIGIQLWL